MNKQDILQPAASDILPGIDELERRAALRNDAEPIDFPNVENQAHNALLEQEETVRNVKPMFEEPAKHSVYVEKHNMGVYTDLQSPEEIDYAVDIQLAKKFRDNYFSLTDMGVRRSSVVGDAINSFSKGIGSMLVSTAQLLERQLTGIADSVAHLPTNFEKWQMDLNEENISINPQTRKEVLDNYEKSQEFRRQKLQMMIDKHRQALLDAGLGRDASDGIMFDIGSGLTSMLGALGLTIVTKSPSSASILFGWIAGRSTYEELVEDGMSPSRAASFGTLSGIAEGALEYIGLDYFIRAMKIKGVAARVIGALEEPLQEGAQATAEEIIMQTFGSRQKEADETINDIFYQALIGAIIGAPVSFIARAGQVSLEKKGVEPEKAKEVSAAITQSATSQQAMEFVEKIINDEDSPLTFPNNDVKKGMQNFINTAREQIKSMTPERRRAINDIKMQVRQDALNAGLTLEESEFAAQTMASLATLWNNAAGISPQEWYNSHKLEIINQSRSVAAMQPEQIVDNIRREQVQYNQEQLELGIEPQAIEYTDAEIESIALEYLWHYKDVHNAALQTAIQTGADAKRVYDIVKNIDDSNIMEFVQDNGDFDSDEFKAFDERTQRLARRYIEILDNDLALEDLDYRIDMAQQEVDSLNADLEIVSARNKRDVEHNRRVREAKKYELGSNAQQEERYIEDTAPIKRKLENAKGRLNSLQKKRVGMEYSKPKYNVYESSTWTNSSNEEQIKSAAFKQWFGDWELAQKFNDFINRQTESVTPHESLSKKAAENVFRENRNIEHSELGNTILPIETVNKLLQHKGFKFAEIFNYLPQLYKNSILLTSDTEKTYQTTHKPHPNIAFWHNTFNKFNIGSDEYIVRFTITESKAGKKQKKGAKGQQTLHSAFVSEIVVDKIKDSDTIKSGNYPARVSLSDNILTQLIDKVNNVSKVVNENGKPLVVYHGRKNIDNVNVFDMTSRQGYGREQNGAYFSAIEEYAASYPTGGGNPTIKAYLSIKNPYYAKDYAEITGVNSVRKSELETLGYDGVVYNDDVDGKNFEVLAFYPNQIKSVNNQGTFDGDNPNIYYQTGYHGGMRGINEFSNDFIGSGEGNQTFGWGHYFTSLKEIAEQYYNQLNYSKNFTKYNAIPYETLQKSYLTKGASKGQVLSLIVHYGGKDKLIKSLENNIEIEKERDNNENEIKRLKAMIEYASTVDETKIEKRSQVYKVDLPESEDFLQLDKPLSKQSQKVQEAVIAAIKEFNEAARHMGKDYLIDEDEEELAYMSGGEIYSLITEKYAKINLTDEPAQETSGMLLKYGVLGNEYPSDSLGGRTASAGRNFVLFDPKLAEIQETYYQNEKVQIPRAAITFEDERSIIRLTKSHDKSSIVHELGHLYLRSIDRLAKISQDENFLALKAKIDKYLKVGFDENGKALYDKEYSSGSGEKSATPHEKFANAFTAYVKTGNAPNSALKRIFIMFRQWLAQIRDVLVDSEIESLQASPEMIEVFNELLAPMEFERANYTSEERQAIKQQIEDIRAGRDIEMSGQRLDEIRNYVNQVNQRRPRAPREDLLYYIRRFGVKETFPLIDKAKDAGIKIINPESPNYRQALGEDNLQSFLTGLEFLQTARDSELDIGSEDLQTQSLSLIEKALDGERIDSADNLSRIEAIEDYDRNVEAIQEMFGGNLAEAERVLDMIDELADRNFAVVSYDTLANLQELADRVEKQNEKLGKGAKMEDIEQSIIRDKNLIKHKNEAIRKKEKELKKRESNLAKKEQEVDTKINVKQERTKIADAQKEIEQDRQYIDDYTQRLEKKEKALAEDKRLYGDIKEVIEQIAQKNKDLGKKIRKEDIEDAIKTNDRQKLLAAVNDALAEVESEIMNMPDYTQTSARYENPINIIRERKKALLETARQRIEDGKDATGFRQALRSALSGIPHFSNVKNSRSLDKKRQVMTGKEQLLDEWRNLKSWQELVDNLNKVFNSVEYMASDIYQPFMEDIIAREVSRPIWVKQGDQKVGRYDKDTNDFFKELQDIWNQVDDPKELEFQFAMQKYALMSDNENHDVDFRTRVKNRIMNYALADGMKKMKLGNQILADLYGDIMTIRNEANRGHALAELEKKINLIEETDRLVGKVKNPDSKKGVGKVLKAFLGFSGNWETYLNFLFGKDAVDQYSLLVPQKEADTANYYDIKNVNERGREIYGVKSQQEFTQIYRDLLNEKFEYSDYKINDDAKPETVQLSKADIITIYIWYKNTELRKRLLMQYEVPIFDEKGKRLTPQPQNLTDMFSKLTEQDKAFGDYLQETAQSYYDSVNEVYMRLYGLDLDTVENYFPSIARTPISDIDVSMAQAQQMSKPSQIKQRAQSPMVRQMPTDPLTIINRHIMSSNRYIFLQEKIGALRKIIRNSKMENAVKNNETFGEDVYKGLLNELDASSISQYKKRMLTQEKLFGKIVNNFLKTAVAVKPIIAIKQVAAFINYSEGMPKSDFIKGVAEFWSNPKEAYKFMMKNRYLNARFFSGSSNETLQRAMENKTFSRFNEWNNMLTVNVRGGDMFSLLMGGYARIKYKMSQGLSEDEAFKDFELTTMRTQQAAQTSSLSGWQRSENPIIRAAVAFRNTPNQYARKIADAYVQFRRGEIDLGQFGEIVALYGVVNPLLYAALTYGITGLFDDDDEDDDIRNILISPLTVNAGFIPLMDDTVLTLTNGLIDGKIKYSGGKGEILGISDFYDWVYKGIKAWNDTDKMELSDWLKVVDFPARAAAGVPLETIATMFSGTVDAFNGEFLRGGLKGLGYSRYRANMIADGRYIKD
ncbi:MAG: hypothetical protein LBD46_08465 [Endomicrobium sp.]|jgi:hypothetical protein|nr:hypothetical protein [Endomicrobium sp.]